ncbi:hypothetical protein HYFRA_00005287 [Hymenoscyphus fraxineus]|uniref:Uncharacterized protein n=1 Tax=Hymenoscyphus fraxineus TaxID=746836 RepID=A0A9N9LA38_9HELO|nr:hypothetical protein HYFRA_00005287 [Hymenoscyphus fraxineus]
MSILTFCDKFRAGNASIMALHTQMNPVEAFWEPVANVWFSHDVAYEMQLIDEGVPEPLQTINRDSEWVMFDFLVQAFLVT